MGRENLKPMFTNCPLSVLRILLVVAFPAFLIGYAFYGIYQGVKNWLGEWEELDSL
jgi:hypothetical protein